MFGDSSGLEEARSRLEAAAGADYEIVRPIGQGGMGQVFLARDRRLGRMAALKVLPPLDTLQPARVERFRREAETAAKLSHPNIVPVYGAGGDASNSYFAMAYIEGETLAERLQREKPIGLPEARRVAREVGQALAYAHRHGVVHRDVKPANILLERESGRAMVTDFGIARALDLEQLTGTGVAMGTPGYMSPEQAAGGGVDARTDQYGLGLICYEMLSGRRFDADFDTWPSEPTMVRKALRTRTSVPDSVAAAISRATSLRREDRFADLDAFLAALLRPARPISRSWAWAAAAALLLALGAALSRMIRAPSRAEGALTGIALLAFDGDSAAADSLLKFLSSNLRSLATVRVADSRVFDPPRGVGASDQRVVQLARKAGAGWILHGLVAGPPGAREVRTWLVEAGGRARTTALGQVRSPDALAAADSMVLLLARSDPARDIGLPTAGLGSPRSMQAYLAFSAAEEAFRRADYAAAAREYARVADLDSTFFVARYKRFLAELQAEPNEAGLRAAVSAVADVIPRVGRLERELLGSYLQLFDSADIRGAERRLQSLVETDSTFLDGWFALGEVRFHFGALAGMEPDSAGSAFRRALELWPGAAPAEMHLVAIDLWEGREDQARSRMDRYLAVDSTSAIARAMSLGKRLLFGGLGDLTRLPRLRRELPTLPERAIELGAITGVAVARNRTDLQMAREGFRELTRPGYSPRVRAEAASFVVATLLSEGRWDDALAALRLFREDRLDSPDLARWPAAASALGFGGARPAAVGPIPRPDLPRVPFSAFASGWLERYFAARRALAAADTAGALAHFAAQDLLASVGDATVRGPVWLEHGRILAARGRPAVAERYFRRAADLLAYAQAPWDTVRAAACRELERLGAGCR